MKKLVFLCVALLVAPAMAEVVFSGDGESTAGECVISYVCEEMVETPRGIALVLTCDGVTITGGTVDQETSKFNCFIDYAYSNDPYDVGDGHPFADPAGAGAVDVSGGVTEVSLCMGVLDEGGEQAAGPAAADIITLAVSGEGTITVTADTLRGPDSGVVGSALDSNLNLVGPLVITVGGVTPPKCVKDTASFYQTWVDFGEPDCWCYVKNCRGDADGELGGDPFDGYYHVGAADLAVLIPAWKVIEPPQGDGLMVVNPGGICADFDRTEGGDPFDGYYRVGAADLAIMITNWKVIEPPHGSVGIADCDTLDYNFWVTP